MTIQVTEREGEWTQSICQQGDANDDGMERQHQINSERWKIRPVEGKVKEYEWYHLA